MKIELVSFDSIRFITIHFNWKAIKKIAIKRNNFIILKFNKLLSCLESYKN